MMHGTTLAWHCGGRGAAEWVDMGFTVIVGSSGACVVAPSLVVRISILSGRPTKGATPPGALYVSASPTAAEARALLSLVVCLTTANFPDVMLHGYKGSRLSFLFFATSSAFHGGNAFVWRGAYLDDIATCRCRSRWAEYFLSATMMIVLIAYTTAVREQTLMLAVGALIATTMGFGWLTEELARPASSDCV